MRKPEEADGQDRANRPGATRVASLSPAQPDFLAVNEMKLATIDQHRIVVVRTSDGVFALDNACPHQGYGLATGSLASDAGGDPAITCQWHNWKFRVADGVCTQGEEDVASHDVQTHESGSVHVALRCRSTEEQKALLWPSLIRGLDRSYVGQIGRDTVRLLDTGASPAEILTAALEATLSRTEDGVGHETALAADCLTLAESWPGDERILPLVNGLAGLSEETRGREPFPPPSPAVGNLVQLIEKEELLPAMAAAGALGHADADPVVARREFIHAAAQHHLGYGHGAIYVQKSFELLGRVGWQVAPVLLPQLARSLTLMTREDTLPYMRKARQVIDQADLDHLAGIQPTGSAADQHLARQLLDALEPPLQTAIDSIDQGHGVIGVLNAVSLGAAQRLLRYDEDHERDGGSFNWLDVTHALTLARAARWAWESDPGPEAVRQALFSVWLLFDSGRAERRSGNPAPSPEPEVTQVPDDWCAWADDLQHYALDDAAGSFIVLAHLVKTTQAALEESQTLATSLPLQAADRFVRGHRRERFVGRAASESLRFVRTGRPPKR